MRTLIILSTMFAAMSVAAQEKGGKGEPTQEPKLGWKRDTALYTVLFRTTGTTDDVVLWNRLKNLAKPPKDMSLATGTGPMSKWAVFFDAKTAMDFKALYAVFKPIGVISATLDIYGTVTLDKKKLTLTSASGMKFILENRARGPKDKKDPPDVAASIIAEIGKGQSTFWIAGGLVAKGAGLTVLLDADEVVEKKD